MGLESRYVKKTNEICPKWSLQLSFWEGSQSVARAPGLLSESNSNTATRTLSENNLLTGARGPTLSQYKWGTVIISHSWLHCKLWRVRTFSRRLWTLVMPQDVLLCEVQSPVTQCITCQEISARWAHTAQHQPWHNFQANISCFSDYCFF